FKLADAKRNESEFGSTDEDQWKKIIDDICTFYFDLEDVWATSWGSLPTEYANSTSSLDDPLIVKDGIQHQMQDGEASEFVDVDEGDEEELHSVEEEEEEALARRPRPQYRQSKLKYNSAKPQQKHQQRQGQGRLEDKDQLVQEDKLPSTSNK
ncbi:hypothetical protein BGZ58_010910, partial [Dissophora ornata]